MQTIFRKLTLVALVLVLAFAALPLTTTYAASLNGTSTSPAPGSQSDPTLVKMRLETIFARQQFRVQAVGQAIENFDTFSAKVQKLLDKAKQKGLNVSSVQAAFDAYKTAFIAGKPIYEKAKAVLDARQGFDSAGKVTSIEQAKTTVKSLAEDIKQYHDTVGDAHKALRDAVKAFREANPRSTPIPTPNG